MLNNYGEINKNNNSYNSETEKNIKLAKNILCNFLIIDFIVIFFISFYLKSKNKNIESLKCKLHSFLLIDCFKLIIYKIIQQNLDSIPNELFFFIIFLPISFNSFLFWIYYY